MKRHSQIDKVIAIGDALCKILSFAMSVMLISFLAWLLTNGNYLTSILTFLSSAVVTALGITLAVCGAIVVFRK